MSNDEPRGTVQGKKMQGVEGTVELYLEGITNIDIYLESELVTENEDSSLQHFSIGDFLE